MFEKDLSSIAQSLAKIAEHLTAQVPFDREAYQKGHNAGVAHHKQAVASVIAPTIESPTVQPVAPVVAAPTLVVAPVTAPMMASPTRTPEPVAPTTEVANTAPFADHAALMTFVMDNYKALGPIKGAKIQDVLTSVGVKNINEVKPEMYAAIKAGVEALKG